MSDKNLTQSYNSRVYDNFLMHWKYIKREKVKGKWRYTYKDDEVKDAAKEVVKATNAYEKTRAKRDKNWNTLMDNIHNVTDDGFQILKKAWSDQSSATTEAEIAKSAAEKKYNELKKDYDKSFGHDVADFLNKSADKIDSAKDWLGSLFKDETPKSKLSDPNGKVIKENVIKEDVIKEDVIKENVIKEDVIDEEYNDALKRYEQGLVSKEYIEELASNLGKPSPTEKSNTSTNTNTKTQTDDEKYNDALKKYEQGLVSKEYIEELASNLGKPSPTKKKK